MSESHISVKRVRAYEKLGLMTRVQYLGLESMLPRYSFDYRKDGAWTSDMVLRLPTKEECFDAMVKVVTSHFSASAIKLADYMVDGDITDVKLTPHSISFVAQPAVVSIDVTSSGGESLFQEAVADIRAVKYYHQIDDEFTLKHKVTLEPLDHRFTVRGISGTGKLSGPSARRDLNGFLSRWKEHFAESVVNAKTLAVYQKLQIITSDPFLTGTTALGTRYRVSIPALGTSHIIQGVKKTSADCVSKILKDINRRIPKEWQEMAGLIVDGTIDWVSMDCPPSYHCAFKVVYIHGSSGIRFTKDMKVANYSNGFDDWDHVYRSLLNDIRGLEDICYIIKKTKEVGLLFGAVSIVITYSGDKVEIETSHTLPGKKSFGHLGKATFDACAGDRSVASWYPSYRQFWSDELRKLFGLTETSPSSEVSRTLNEIFGPYYIKCPMPQSSLGPTPAGKPGPGVSPAGPALTFLLEATPQPTFFFKKTQVDTAGIFLITNYDPDNMITQIDTQNGLASLRSRKDSVIVDMKCIWTVREGPNAADEWLRTAFELGQKFDPESKYVILANPDHVESYQMAVGTYRMLAGV